LDCWGRQAEKIDGGYRVTARKSFASGAPAGDVFVTSAVIGKVEGATIIHFAVPMDSPHVKVLDTWRALGMRGSGSHDIVIDGHFVPDAAVLERRKAGEWHPLFHVIATIAFPLIYAVYLGVAESARDIAIELAKRKQPGHQSIQIAGRMDTELTARSSIYARRRPPQRSFRRLGQSGYDGSTARRETCNRNRRLRVATRGWCWVLSHQRSRTEIS
jgi:alkylation response protein AidB-like acyl-CoA dehydrogenase